jgi:hypothetical protein
MRGLIRLLLLIGGFFNQRSMKSLASIFFILCQCIINASFISAQSKVVPDSLYERMIIDTDREAYIAGELVHFKLSLFQGQSFKYSGLSKYAYVILVNESGHKLISFPVSLSNGVFYNNFLLPDTLSTGTYRLISFTNWMRNFNPENYAFRNFIVANRFDKNMDQHSKIKAGDTSIYSDDRFENKHIIVSPLKQEYHCGDSIIISVGLSDSAMVNACISVSVAENAPVGNINSNKYSVKAINDDALSSELRFIPEINQPVIQGRVLKKNNPVAGATILLASPDSIPGFQYATTDNKGIFRFQLSNYFDDRKLVINVSDQTESDLHLEYDNKYNVIIREKIYPFTYQLPDYLIHSQKIVSIQKSYFNFQQQKKADYRRELPPMLYLKPRRIVNPSDFIDLVDMVDISREILPSVRIYKKDKEFKIEVFNSGDQVYFKTPPLILYNGVPVDHLNQILHFGSDDISRIDIIDAPWVYGDLEFPGVLGIFSSNYSLDKISYGANTLIVDNQGHRQSIRFDGLSPDSNNNPDHFPDFRQLLYWNPDLTIFHEKPVLIKFKAPQNEGIFNIVINGITGNNQPLTSYYTFLVKK